ncbi:MAG: NAD(P)/FAD-dependent oxidoreductase [Methanotrichaceae archaeon]|nr:NAD(P)/FAD-dependent oxidoreductase [Methanotrichaceae archaeon]
MDTKSMIIIGSGFSGLSAGIYAQANGYSSTILEQHNRAGGLAAWWRRGDYNIDGGVHFLMGHTPGNPIYELYEELGITDGKKFLDLNTYLRFHDQASGMVLDISGDLENLEMNLFTQFLQDGKLIEDLTSKVREMQHSNIMFKLGLTDPPELQSLIEKAKTLWELRHDMKYFSGEYAEPINKYAASAKDPLFRDVLQNLFLESSPLWFVLMILALATNKQLGLLADGCEGLVNGLVNKYESLGGTIEYRKRVKEILVQDGQAIGVILSDGTKMAADIVISAADGRSTIFEMLGGRFVDKEIEKRYATWMVSPSYVTASFGVAGDFAGQPPFGIIFLKRPMICEGKETGVMSYRLLNYGEKFAPKGKCLIQAMCGGDFEFWKELRNDIAKYRIEKERLAGEMLQRLDEVFTGFVTQVEMMDVATPCTTFRYTGNWKGAMMGWMPTTKQMMKTLSRSLPGLNGFYMIGQWAQPGGGVPSCLMQGRNIVQILCHQDGQKFRVPR